MNYGITPFRRDDLASDCTNNPTPPQNHTLDTSASSSADVCHFNRSLQRKIYVYPIPSHMREDPRYLWYSRFSGLDNYNDSAALNFGFGAKMFSERDSDKPDMHLTHMHGLEVILNERLKTDDYYLTHNPEEAHLFHIPYPFALHYRFWERTESKRIAKHHRQLQDWLNADPVYQRYFLNKTQRRPHILSFGRIAYETVRLETMGSQFFKINRGWFGSCMLVKLTRVMPTMPSMRTISP